VSILCIACCVFLFRKAEKKISEAETLRGAIKNIAITSGVIFVIAAILTGIGTHSIGVGILGGIIMSIFLTIVIIFRIRTKIQEW
jgi:MFS superfamily sulfate permease-like transporter